MRVRPSLIELLCLLVGTALVIRFAWLLDDAYIYFRYADNLVIHHAGFVWNPGEFVEGFSSPLWALFLAGLRFLRLDYWVIVPVVGVLSFAAFWWMAVLVNRKLAEDAGGRVASLNIPLIFVTLNYGVLSSFTSGLETPFVLVMAAVYACLLLWPGSLALQVLVGLSPMVRHELLIPFLLALLYVTVRTKRPPIAAIAGCLATLGPYLVFRVWYYADLLPNTFYLKDEIWVGQGLKYLYDAVAPYSAIAYLLAALVLYALLRGVSDRTRLHRNERLAMVALSLPVVAYVTKIGGSSLHMKALVFPFCLTILATGGLAEAAVTRWAERAGKYLWILALAFGVVVAASHPRQLSESPILSRHKLVYQHADLIGDAYYQRHTATARVTPSWGSDLLSYGKAARRHSGRKSPAARADGWCKTGYVRAAAPIVHSLGLTDPFLARTRMRSDRPDHREGLRALADHIAGIRRQYGFRAGAFDAAISDGAAPRWVTANITTIRQIEARAYNSHRLAPNLKLALSRVPKIELPPGQAPEPVPPAPGPAGPAPPARGPGDSG
jgi:hypothetical protein